MKKLAFLMMAAACFILTACPSGQPENVNGEDNTENTEVTETEQQDEETLAATETEQEQEDVQLYQYNVGYMEFDRLNKEFEVKGTPNMESFYKALPFYNPETENFTYYDDDIEVILDEENQFFRYYYCYFEDHCGYDLACWDRTDGKKLMIVFYDDFYSYETGPCQAGEPVVSPWLYAKTAVRTSKWEGETTYRITGNEAGFVAYLYNEDTHMLEPLSEPPFNGWEAKETFRFLNLPQDGSRDIEVVTYRDIPDKAEICDHPIISHLKWNGMTFDYRK